MAVTVMHNHNAQLSLTDLNNNSNRAAKALSKIATGLRIVDAKSDASNYGVTEKMREQIRSMFQDNQNVQNGLSILKIADYGINQIVQELRRLKDLAKYALDESKTEIDRLTLQKEFDSRVAEINDIAIQTKFNGKRLLDGSWEKRPIIEAAEVYYVADEEIDPKNPPPLPEGYPHFQNLSAPSTANHGEINSSSNVVTVGGIYEINPNFTGTLKIDTTDPVKLMNMNPAQALRNVKIEGPAGGNANIWIENFNVSNRLAQSVMKFQGSNNFLTVVGTNNSLVSSGAALNYALINIGDGLSIQNDGGIDNGGLTLNIANGAKSSGAAIGSDLNGSGGYIIIHSVDVTATVYDGACIGSGERGSVGDIIIEDSTMNLKGHYNANIGSGATNASSGNIIFVKSNIISDNYDTAIGSGYPTSMCGNIGIYNSTADIKNVYSACIGSGDTSTCGDIYVSNSTIVGKSTNGACIGTGRRHRRRYNRTKRNQ